MTPSETQRLSPAATAHLDRISDRLGLSRTESLETVLAIAAMQIAALDPAEPPREDVGAPGPTDERAELLRKLREAEHLAGIGSWEWDLRTNRLWLSDELYRIFDLVPGSIRTVEEFIAMRPPERREDFRRALLHAVETRTPLVYDTPAYWRNGEVRMTRGRGRVTLDAEGRLLRMMGAVQDITERVRAERAIALKTAELEAANELLRAQAEELDAQRSELERLVQLKDEFLSCLSHELRTPLTTLQGSIELAERYGARSDSPELRAGQRRMRLAVSVLSELLDGLLSAAELQGGGISLRRAPMRVDELLSDAIDEQALQASSRGVALRCEPVGPLGAIVADRHRLAQVLRNLISNALRHTGEGGAVTVRARLETGQLWLEVEDDGEGVDPAIAPRLFERFSGEGRGLGLGLFIVRELITAHGGTVDYESRTGEGSRFYCMVPIEPVA